MMEKIFNEAANKGGVYRIRNKINGTPYIGSTIRFKQRIMEHERSLRKGNHHSRKLQRAWNKYKEEAFIFEVLEIVEGDMVKRTTVEQKYLDEIKDWKRCYNNKKKTIQKQGPWSSTPEETKKKLSLLMSGEKNPMYGATGEKNSMYGVRLTGEKNGMYKNGQAITGEKNPMYGKKHSTETKEKIRRKALGRKFTGEHKRKISDANKIRWEKYRKENSV